MLAQPGSCEDIHMVQSPEHPPLPNGSHDPLISEFPSEGPPAGQKLQLDTLMAFSASDIHLDTNNRKSIPLLSIWMCLTLMLMSNIVRP